MKRALFVTTVPQTLGFLFPFARHFRQQGWTVDAMAQKITAYPRCDEFFDHLWDINWSRNPADLKNLVQAPQALRKIITTGAYDLVHVHTPIAAFVTRFALRSMRKKGKPKVIYTAHGFHFYKGGSPLKNAFYLGLEKVGGRWTDYLVIMNREDHEAAKRYRLLPSSRIRFMPGIGVDTKYYSSQVVEEEDVLRIRRELNLDQDDPVFLMIGEFIPRKRHKDAVLALARMSHRNAHLAFAGAGPLEDEMKKLAETLGIRSRIHFLGFRRDIPTLLKASTALLLPSTHEGLPRSLMEAFCLSVPCIGSDIRGVQDLFEGDCGILVKVGDVQGLSEVMDGLLENPEQARALGERGRSRIAHFDLQKIIAMHEDLYAEALQGS